MRKRTAQRAKRTSNNAAIDAHERAGDAAREYHVYELAARHYKDALELSDADESAWIRISEKLAEALALSDEPGSMSAINDRLLEVYPLHPERSAEHIRTLFRVARQLWIDSRTQDKLPVLSKAVRIAELSNNLELLQQANIRMANAFTQLARFEEADRHLRAVGSLHDGHGTLIHIDYYTQKAAVAHGLGRKDEAFASLDRAIEVAKDDLDPYYAANLWSEYGSVAFMFGRTKIAKAHREYALLVARRSRIGWLIPTYCIWYAELLMYMGEYSSAYEFLAEALSSDAYATILEDSIVSIGIPLALQLKDETTLEKCARPDVIERVFLSGEPYRIGRVAAAFARLYTQKGHREKAQTLLHRAVEAIHNAAEALQLPLEIARSGAKADFPKARRLLEARSALPCADVAQAYLSLFDAFVAQREGRGTEGHEHARQAAARFDTFSWRMYADLARSLLPIDERRGPAAGVYHTATVSDTHIQFTEREREVAALILKGLSNRAMANALSITENTVEKHVASVMNKLGIRSRHQLTDHLTDSVMRAG